MADPMLIVSPHLDDAVLSCGQLMAGRPGCVVVTVFAGLPPRSAISTSYDQACGFANAAEAIRGRVLEDADALTILEARPWPLGFIDHQYREVEALTVDPWEIAEQLARAADESGARIAMGPVGLAHPDHELTAEAFRLFLTLRRQIEPWLYEDMPSRVLWPEQVPARIGWWTEVAGFHPELGFAGTGPIDEKKAAVGCYPSQAASLRQACGGNLYPVLVPERHWRLWRNEP